MIRALKIAIGCLLVLAFARYGIFLVFAPKPHRAAKGYSVPHSGMEPSIRKGDRIFVLQYAEAGVEPQRFDPVAFKPADDSQTRLARIIGLPGETIQIREGRVLINSRPLPDSLTYTDMGGAYGWNTTMQPGTYFLLADNRSTNDSRFVGPIPKHELIGVVKSIYWPIWRAGVPSNHSVERPAAQ